MDIDPVGFLTNILAILIALSVHEWAHAATAAYFGDPTAHNEGRLTLNPIAHLDPIGTLVFVMTSLSGHAFGWAKPVPVNPSYFAHPKRQMAIVALAGPVSNLILALLSIILLCVVYGGIPSSVYSLLTISSTAPASVLAFQLLSASLFVNLGLAAFNLLPIAPLDGSKILQLFVPWRYERQYDDFLRIGPFVLLALIFVGPYLPINPIGLWVGAIIRGILAIVEIPFSMF